MSCAGKDTPIRLTARAIGESVQIEVSETESDLPPDIMKTMLDPFPDGLCLGLARIQLVVQQHGGTISVSSPGEKQGATYTVTLPLAPPLPVGPPDSAVITTATDTTAVNGKAPTRRRIFVVDDNRDAADGLGILLESMGHEVQVGYDGLAALETVKTFRPHVVLLDIGLPQLNGYDAARRIRQSAGSSVLLIALTGWGSEADKLRSHEAGFDHHLMKPIEIQALLRLITGSRE